MQSHLCEPYNAKHADNANSAIRQCQLCYLTMPIVLEDNAIFVNRQFQICTQCQLCDQTMPSAHTIPFVLVSRDQRDSRFSKILENFFSFSLLVLDLEPFQFHFHFSEKSEGILFFTFHFSKKVKAIRISLFFLEKKE